MDKKEFQDSISLYDLEWDTNFFGITCAKAILHSNISTDEWKQLKDNMENYEFVSIENLNSEPINAQVIGRDTKAFLADVNIQFIKEIEINHNYKMQSDIKVCSALDVNAEVTNLANFQFSKFVEDPDLDRRGGSQVYKHWVLNSLKKPNKLYILSKDSNENINGFLLYSYSKDICTVELIAVAQNSSGKGIGTNLFRALEYEVYNQGINIIRVGTQVRNTAAVNFYHRMGCKQVGCHQVYHLWNI
jgi:dTDP-4-amino-4,6-dideoxy-D-galactose acyltransferase